MLAGVSSKSKISKPGLLEEGLDSVEFLGKTWAFA